MRRHSLWLKWLVCSVLTLGLVFRFYHLDQKFYWFDEAFTSLRVSGYTEQELVTHVSQVPRISVAELLQHYQYPTADKGAGDTVKSLAIEEPQHPPLYFVIARSWLTLFGHSTAALRSLSAVCSLLALPGMYWLGRELFRSADAALLAVVCLASSPFFILYAQEAREYSLWTVTILLSSAALLRSIRLGTARSWAGYAVSLVIGLYTFPATLLVMVAHGVYLLLVQKTAELKAYAYSSAIGLLIFSPWFCVIGLNLAQVNKTFIKPEKLSPAQLLSGWMINLYRLFIDLSDYEREINYGGLNHLWLYLVQLPLMLLILLLVGSAFVWLYQRTEKQIYALIFTLSGVVTLPLMLINLTIGGRQSIVPRYLIPACLAVELAVASLLAAQLAAPQTRRRAGAIVIALSLAGFVSAAVSAQSPFWWTKSHSDMNYAYADVINRGERSLVVSDAPMGRILAFSHRLNSTVQLQLQPSCYSCADEPVRRSNDLADIPETFSDVFLYNPSPQLLKQMAAQQFTVVPIYRDPIHIEQRILKISQRSDR